MIRRCYSAPLILLACAMNGRAQQVPPAPTPAPAWISLTISAENSEILRGWNPQTGACVDRTTTAGKLQHIEFQDPAADQLDTYQPDGDGADPRITSIIRSALTPAERAALLAGRARASMNFPDLLPQLKTYFGEAGFKITNDTDRGMTRYTLEPTGALKRESFGIDEDAAVVMVSRAMLTLPATLWVDPETKRIREIACGNRQIRISYEGPAPASLLDLGVPRDAPLFDCRPTQKTLAVYDRVTAQLHKPLPDGALVILRKGTSTNATSGVSLETYAATGIHWQHRQYRTNIDPALIPADWTDARADAFFQYLGTLFPNETYRSDGTTMLHAILDRETHEEFHNGISAQSRNEKRPGPAKFTGRSARLADSGPSTVLLPFDLEGARYMHGSTLGAATSKDHPGLEGLIWRERSLGPDTLQAEAEYWFDPAHDDRPVTVISTQYADDFGKKTLFRRETQVDAYAKTPAPDNRTYAAHWIDTSSINADSGQQHGETTVHFFPGRNLPDVPKPPQGLP